MKDRQINIRLSESDYQRILDIADENGCSRSEWLRDVIQAALKKCPTCGRGKSK